MERIPDIRFKDKKLAPIWDKVVSGRPLEMGDGLVCLQTSDLISLGKMASWVKEEKSGNFVYFVINAQLNPTNLCVLDCKFCDFAAKPGDTHAYNMTTDEALARLNDELREVHIVGGLWPDWDLEHSLELMDRIRERFPSAQLKAFTAVEIDFFAKRTKLSVEGVLKKLMEHGLVALPGGGAEVFSQRVKKELFDKKIGEERWLEIHEIAHRLGLKSNATLLYGHIETMEERVDHLLKLRAQQERSGGFLTFIPLAFQPGNTGITNRFTSAVDDLRTLATSRLVLDNFPHIKSYWVMLGENTASIGLNFGGDDLDGTIGEEKIAHLALAESPVGLTRDRLMAMIREAGRTPVERDACYNVLNVYENGSVPKENLKPQLV